MIKSYYLASKVIISKVSFGFCFFASTETIRKQRGSRARKKNAYISK